VFDAPAESDVPADWLEARLWLVPLVRVALVESDTFWLTPSDVLTDVLTDWLSPVENPADDPWPVVRLCESPCVTPVLPPMERGIATPKLNDLLPWVSLRTWERRVATLFHARVMSSMVSGTVTSVRMKPRRVALIPRMKASMAL
jgi:hypothetical protein